MVGFCHFCLWSGKERETWTGTIDKRMLGIATGYIMATEGGEYGFMECCCAVARKNTVLGTGTRSGLKSFPEVKENGKIEKND